jgi:hypothetical protein
MEIKQTFHAGFDLTQATGCLKFVRSVVGAKILAKVPRAYEIVRIGCLVKSVIYPDGETAEFTYQGSHPSAARIRGREFVFDSEADIFKEGLTSWYDLRVMHEDSPLYSSGTVVLSRWDLLEVIAPLICYKVWFKPDRRIYKITYPDRTTCLFIYHDEVLSAVKNLDGEAEQQWRLVSDGEQSVFAEGKVRRLQVISDPKSTNFGSLSMEASDGDVEVRAVYTINGNSIVMRYQRGSCISLESTAADGRTVRFTTVSPGLAVCELTGQLMPMPDYTHLFQ